ncbi:uncharacterized protein (DUF305 family) [Nocardiopsis terrae]|uniref:Uncharacterized protein (DUF305 family) n=1 Tax=Nocardiopsis terrae TaxID=372655 RepID=A0ABR9HM71_9ACTN|nr:hypothetical protein [Nocardiopsis terrae]MBE1460103.1 uncharacterized protein (DUF305 family) [Nocardiopsis terrae]
MSSEHHSTDIKKVFRLPSRDTKMRTSHPLILTLASLGAIILITGGTVYFTLSPRSEPGGDADSNETSAEYAMESPSPYSEVDLGFISEMYLLRSQILKTMDSYEGGDPQIEILVSGVSSLYRQDLTTLEAIAEKWGEDMPNPDDVPMPTHEEIEPERWEVFADIDSDKQDEELLELMLAHQRSILLAVAKLEEGPSAEVDSLARSTSMHATMFITDLEDLQEQM